MAKRANPYVEDFIPQSKIHVGSKQFNNNEDRLKKVYEKTLELLFKGAKKLPSVQDSVLDNIICDVNKGDNMKQLTIGKNGNLEHYSSIKSEVNTAGTSCPCGSSLCDADCAYCEVKLCSSCQHLCTSCDQIYCSSCSLTGPSGAEVCVSCYH